MLFLHFVFQVRKVEKMLPGGRSFLVTSVYFINIHTELRKNFIDVEMTWKNEKQKKKLVHNVQKNSEKNAKSNNIASDK